MRSEAKYQKGGGGGGRLRPGWRRYVSWCVEGVEKVCDIGLMWVRNDMVGFCAVVRGGMCGVRGMLGGCNASKADVTAGLRRERDFWVGG